MGTAALVRGWRQRERDRVLVAVRLCQCDLDPRGTDQLESHRGAELGVCRRGLRDERWVFGAESLARGQRYGREDKQATGGGRGGAACCLGIGYQDSLLRVSSIFNIMLLELLFHAQKFLLKTKPLTPNRHGSPASKTPPKPDGGGGQGDPGSKIGRALLGL